MFLELIWLNRDHTAIFVSSLRWIGLFQQEDLLSTPIGEKNFNYKVLQIQDLVQGQFFFFFNGEFPLSILALKELFFLPLTQHVVCFK